MPPVEHVGIDLRGLVLPDARTGEPLHLGDLRGVTVLTALRHRY